MSDPSPTGPSSPQNSPGSPGFVGQHDQQPGGHPGHTGYPGHTGGQRVLVPRRQLMRSRDSKVLAGVAGGFGEYFTMDPVILRVLLVVAGLLSGGLIFIPYFLCLFIIPKAPHRFSPDPTGRGHNSQQFVPGSESWATFQQPFAEPSGAGMAGSVQPAVEASRSSLFAAIAIGFGLLGLSSVMGVSLDVGFLWPLAFIGFGVAVLWSRQTSRQLPADNEVAGAHDHTAQFVATRGVVEGGRHDPYDMRAYQSAESGTLRQPFANTPEPPVAGSMSAPAKRRKQRVQTRYSRGAPAVYMMIVGASLLLGRLGVFGHWSTRDASAFALTLLGVMVLLGAWLGRPKMLTVGVLLSVFLGFVAVVGPNFGGGVGGRIVTITTPAEITPQRLDAGEVLLDLRKFKATPGKKTEPLDVQVSLGQVRIVLPPNVAVRTHAKVSGGEVVLNGVSQASGVDLDVTDTYRAPKSVLAKAAALGGAGASGTAVTKPAAVTTLDLNVDLGFGSMQIEYPDPAKADVPIVELYPDAETESIGPWVTTERRVTTEKVK